MFLRKYVHTWADVELLRFSKFDEWRCEMSKKRQTDDMTNGKKTKGPTSVTKETSVEWKNWTKHREEEIVKNLTVYFQQRKARISVIMGYGLPR